MPDSDSNNESQPPSFDAAQISAFAHLYRAEVYRSTAWRLRFDNTSNWAVVTTGIAFSASFSSASASPVPLVLVGLLVVFFLLIEARRFRYFDIWRWRARVLETEMYVPMLRGKGLLLANGWNERLASDYADVRHRMGFVRAVGRRLRNNYAWIFLIQAIAYYGKLAIHPLPLRSLDQLWSRAAIGPFPGQGVIAAGILFHGGWACFAAITLYRERQHKTPLHDPHMP